MGNRRAEPAPSEDDVDATVRAALAVDASSAVPADVDDGELVRHRAGTLSPADRARVDAQLAASPATRALYDALGEPPPLDRLRRAEEAVRGGVRRSGGRTLAAAAAVLLAVGVGGALSSRGRPDAATPPSYTLVALEGAVARERGRGGATVAPGDAAPVFDADGVIALALAPDAPTEPPTVRVDVSAPEGLPRDTTAAWEVQRFDGGGLRLRAPARDVLLAGPGTYEIQVRLGEAPRAAVSARVTYRPGEAR